MVCGLHRQQQDESEEIRKEGGKRGVLSLFNKTVNVLSGMLNYRAKRHQVLLSNIANLDVPEYKASDLALKNQPVATIPLEGLAAPGIPGAGWPAMPADPESS